MKYFRFFSIGALAFFGLCFSSDVSAAIVTEPITFAVNDDYAQQHPDWKDRATEIITDVNKIFSKTTDLRYEIVSFKTYPIKDYPGILQKNDYYSMQQLSGYSFGTTLFSLADRKSVV